MNDQIEAYGIRGIVSTDARGILSLQGIREARAATNRRYTLSSSIPLLNGYGIIASNCKNMARKTWNEWMNRMEH